MHETVSAPTAAHSPDLAPRPARTALRRLAGAAAAALLAAAGLLAGASPALAHDQLMGIEGELSADGTEVSMALTFNNQPMNIGTEFSATGPDGADLLVGEPAFEGRDVVQRIALPGFDQTVVVNWRVVSSDGHGISGSFAFAVLERDGGTELQFRDVPEAPAAESSDSASVEEEPRDLLSPGVRIALVIGAGSVAAATAVAAVVASRRRKQAFEEAQRQARESAEAAQADPAEQDPSQDLS